ncbi:Protein CBG02179 [Caenorhabditis briggsae]|uniref:Protein CBG02179 n=1 Tax=Caenorhabditis briggsae TaxID=6238 RepID=A8WS46_CAEBR|nr:Protein CBG02179 [Caenorhabditis briggsae]CAP23304.2 Protein CBG02179 [Caenorhabditis briggsae]
MLPYLQHFRPSTDQKPPIKALDPQLPVSSVPIKSIYQPHISVDFALPSFANGRLPTATKHMKLSMKRSNSETRPLPKIEYGRSESREQLTDLRDELFQAKKKVAGYEKDMRKMGTEMKRMQRDAEKRETFLERIVTAQYHPTELNDTHLARTLTSIKRKEMAKENLIAIQSKELERLRALLRDVPGPLEHKHPTQSMEISEIPESEPSEEEVESDYPEDDELDEVFETPKKETTKLKGSSKERKELAKKYAEQNEKLKQKLKEMKANYVSIVEKNKKKGEEFAKQMVEKTEEISIALDSLQKEKEDLAVAKKKNEEEIDNLNQELIEAYGEIDALKMHNEKLQENLKDLEVRFGNVNLSDYETNIMHPLNIPRLDMTDIDVDENCTLHEYTDRSVSTDISEYDHDILAGVLAEIAGAHCERLRLITQE